MVILFAVIFGLLPSFVWLIFFLKEDIHPEPKKMIIRVFLAGVLIALVAVVFQLFLQQFFDFLKISHYSIFSFFVFGASEEILKFLAVYLTVHKNKFFDEPIDAMMYMIVAALGFAALENIFIASNGLIFNNFKNGELFSILTIRFVGATLFHALGSGVVGYYWAKTLASQLSKVKCQMLIIKGLVIATFLHAVFNYSIIIFKDANILIYPLIFLIIIALVVFKNFERVKGFIEKFKPQA